MTSKQVTSPPWNSRRGAQAKKWFGHCAGLSPCAHSIGKFFLCYIVLFLLETSAPGLSGHYWYIYIYSFLNCLPGEWCLKDIRWLGIRWFYSRFYSQLLRKPASDSYLLHADMGLCVPVSQSYPSHSHYIEFFTIFFRGPKLPMIVQSGPIPVISRVITPLIGFITQVTHLIIWQFLGVLTPFRTSRAHLVWCLMGSGNWTAEN